MRKITVDRTLDMVEMRTVYADIMTHCAARDDRIVAIQCDMSSSMGMAEFHKTFPDRSYNAGIQEANALAMSAGMAAVGFIPVFHTFACFATRRVYDQAYVSCGYARMNVKIVGGEAGITAAANGGTHMPLEDIGIMRNIPGCVILDPCDSVQVKKLVPEMLAHNGLVYMRLNRKQAKHVYADHVELEIGKAVLLREGSDVTIIAAGIMVTEALDAADKLCSEGIEARVLDMFTIKPIDVKCILESAEITGCIVTVENHSTVNGLGSAVAEVLIENDPVPMERIGVRDEFGEVGTVPYLMERFQMTAKDICDCAKRVISRKKQVASHK